MHLFPAIDLREGKVVRLMRGDYAQQTTYGTDPLEQAREFERAGASWLHVVDLDGARSGRMTHLDAIGRICGQTKLRVEVGGGVRTEGAVQKLLELGVERVVLGTAALENWPWFEALMGNPTYRGRLVLGLDARKGRLAVSGWEKVLDATAVDIARKVRDWPLAAIVFTDIATDGTMQGPNLPSLRAMAEATHVPIVASGGIGDLTHLRQVRGLGDRLTHGSIQGVIVGRAIYEGAFTTEQAVQTLER